MCSPFQIRRLNWSQIPVYLTPEYVNKSCLCTILIRQQIPIRQQNLSQIPVFSLSQYVNKTRLRFTSILPSQYVNRTYLRFMFIYQSNTSTKQFQIPVYLPSQHVNKTCLIFLFVYHSNTLTDPKCRPSLELTLGGAWARPASGWTTCGVLDTSLVWRPAQPTPWGFITVTIPRTRVYLVVLHPPGVRTIVKPVLALLTAPLREQAFSKHLYCTTGSRY